MRGLKISAYYAQTAVFGYIIGGSTVFTLKEAELVVASSIIALGATRQASSHCKGALQLGNSVETLTAIVDVASDIAEWNRKPLGGVVAGVAGVCGR